MRLGIGYNKQSRCILWFRGSEYKLRLLFRNGDFENVRFRFFESKLIAPEKKQHSKKFINYKFSISLDVIWNIAVGIFIRSP